MKSKNRLLIELYTLMTNAGWSIEDLDSQSGVSADFIESWFADKCNPSLENLQFCFQALGYELRPEKTDNSARTIRETAENKEIKSLIKQGEHEQIVQRYKEASDLIIKLYNKLKYEDQIKFQNHISACKAFISRNSLYERIV